MSSGELFVMSPVLQLWDSTRKAKINPFSCCDLEVTLHGSQVVGFEFDMQICLKVCLWCLCNLKDFFELLVKRREILPVPGFYFITI